MSFVSSFSPMPGVEAVMSTAVRCLVLLCLLLSPLFAHAGVWGEVARFAPALADQPDPGADVRFGHAVAVDGDWLIVGAPHRLRPNGSAAGSVFIYRSDAAGAWKLNQRILFSTNGGECGTSVALRGRFAVVGCPMQPIAGLGHAGRVLIYQRNDAGVYEQPVYLLGTQNDERFGHAVSIAGTGEVGQTFIATTGLNRFRDEDGVVSNGGVSVYVLSQSTPGSAHAWELDAQVASPIFHEGGYSQQFGHAIDLHRTGTGELLLAVGMPNWNVDVGKAFVYSRNLSGTWSINATFDAPVAGEFGFSVAMSGSHLAVGAPLAGGGGRVHAYVRRAGDWVTTPLTLAPLLTPFVDSPKQFGRSLAMAGEDLWVGSPEWTSSDGRLGHAWRFLRTGSGQTVGDPLAYSDEQHVVERQVPSTHLGHGLAVDAQGTTVIGAPKHHNGDEGGWGNLLPQGQIFIHHRDSVFSDGLEWEELY